jgi:hypothetical protein
MNGRAVVLLHRQHVDPVLSEEHRRRQPHETAPDHEHGNIDRWSTEF